MVFLFSESKSTMLESIILGEFTLNTVIFQETVMPATEGRKITAENVKPRLKLEFVRKKIQKNAAVLIL